MSRSVYDAIVVGLGGMGSAALYHLASRGSKVLGLERFGVAHDQGSSHGLSRIIRLAYHEHESYVPLLQRAYQLWQELEDLTGKELLTITGSVEAAAPGVGAENCCDNAHKAALLHGLPHELLSGDEVNRRFPGYCLPADFKALYQPKGGILASERCIEAHVQAALAAGAEVHLSETVLSWCVTPETDGNNVTVTTDKGTYKARRLVLTPGAWIAQLVPALKDSCKVYRQVVGWFEAKKETSFTVQNFPVFLLQTPRGYWYGFPTFGHPGMKIGKFYHLWEESQPDSLSRVITAADEEVLREPVREYFPDANGALTKAAACMFTMTPDGHFIVDLHPVHPEVVICSACSGHGFKFCSVIGEILADLATRGSTGFDISMLLLNPAREGHTDVIKELTSRLSENS